MLKILMPVNNPRVPPEKLILLNEKSKIKSYTAYQELPIDLQR